MSAISNLPSEESVLGSLMVSEPALERVIDKVKLRADDFYLDKHRAIYDVILELHRRAQPVDELTVAHALAQADQTEMVGGADFISNLAANVPDPGNVQTYAGHVIECSLRRATEATADDLKSGKLDPDQAIARLAEVGKRTAGASSDGVKTVSFASIEKKQVSFLWEERIPLGMMTLLMGDPGLGKSLFTTMLAAPVSRAGAGVLLLTGEDDRASTIKPRLEAAGADMENVHTIEIRRDGVDEGIALPDDGHHLSRIVTDKNVRLVIVDPLMAFLPDSVNSWRDQSVRRALAPLYRIAEESRCAVVIVAHLNKGKTGNALHRTGGSIGIPAAVRSALLLARDPSDPDPERGTRRVLAHAKCNVGQQKESLACEIEVVNVDLEEVPRLRIIGTSDTTAAELLDTPEAGEMNERDEAEEFLLAELAEGPREAREVEAARREAGISERTLRRAKGSLRVKSQKTEGMNGRWMWSLPDPKAGGHVPEGGHDDKGGHSHISPVAPFPSKAKSVGEKSPTEDKGGQPLDMAVAMLETEMGATVI